MEPRAYAAEPGAVVTLRATIARCVVPVGPERVSARALSRAASVLALGLLVGCAPAAQQGASSDGRPREQRTLVLATLAEPDHFGTKFISSGGIAGGGGTGGTDSFMEALSARDAQGVKIPLLAEKLPELNTGSWRVFPDGRMETIYRLRPGLTWHDGHPLTADDFLFTYHVYNNPELGAGLTPQNLMEDLVVLDERTMLFKWKEPTTLAGAIASGKGGLPPLPRHLLEDLYRHSDGKSFLALSYWRNDYVGLGPYRLERWEPGAFLEGTAFENYAMGRPKIERIRYLFFANSDTLLAAFLSGAVHTTIGNRALGFAQGQVLMSEWGSGGTGTVQASPTDLRYIQIQFKPRYQGPRALSDLRVRKALSHAIDKAAIADALLQEHGKTAALHFVPHHPYFAEADHVVTKYPYDLRRADQLLTEAGMVRGSNGFYQSANGDPFHLEVLGDDEKELLVLTDGLKAANISTGIDVLTPARNRDRSVVTLYPALSTQKSFYRGFPFMVTFFSEGIATEARNWAGSNRGGYSSPEYDALYRRQVASLDEDEIARIDVEIAKHISEQIPGIPLYHLITVDAHVSSLRGPGPVSTESTRTWNIHQWEWVN